MYLSCLHFGKSPNYLVKNQVFKIMCILLTAVIKMMKK